jgi:hypothetical protein
MGFYGYCVVPGSHRPPEGLKGLEAAIVAFRPVGGLAVWYSDMSRPDPTIEHIRSHNATVEMAVTEAVTPVPLRFGQWADEAGVFDRIITEKLGWYEDRLRVFAGAMEFGLRIVRPDKQTSAQLVRVPPSESGTAYMNALRARASAKQDEQAEAELVRARIAETVVELVLEERVEDARTPHGLVTISHLVPRKHFEAYRERVHSLREQLGELRFLLSGPWLPYSFAV